MEVLGNEAAGFWNGQLRVLMNFIRNAAFFRGAPLSGGLVRHEGWGLYGKAGGPTRTQGGYDFKGCRSNAHLLARTVGSWPVKWHNPGVEISLAWLSGERGSSFFAHPRSLVRQ